jgi:type II secretory pathway pseudopilin PulG
VISMLRRRTNPTPWASRASEEGGFTLVELLISVVLVPVVVGGLALALLSVFNLQGGVSNRISDSADAQLVSSTYESDVQSATCVTTNSASTNLGLCTTPANLAPCGTNTQVLGLQWGNGTEVTYGLNGNELVRAVCKSGNSSTPVSTSVVSHNAPTLASGNIKVAVTCNSTLANPLTSGTAYTTLNVSPLPTSILSGHTIAVGSSSSTVTNFVASANQGAGSTTIAVNSLTPTTSYPLGSQVNDPTWEGTSPNTNCGTGSAWISGLGVTGVTLSITQKASSTTPSYAYTLVGLPGASSSQVLPSSTTSVPTTTCGFASPGTGTYAGTLCFVDFSPYNPPASGCQQMTAGVTGTTYTLSFCITESGGPVSPATIPTYFNPPTSEAYMGNNGFYTGIPGNPALYQECEGGGTGPPYFAPCNGNASSVITITNIQVLESNGTAATGWKLVTGDAESTDASESISWASNQPLNLLPDDPSSPYGNACATSTSPPYNPQLSGLGTTSVTCSATVSSDKTGTVMLDAVAPTSAPLTLTVTMLGGGLQAMFLGMILP